MAWQPRLWHKGGAGLVLRPPAAEVNAALRQGRDVQPAALGQGRKRRLACHPRLWHKGGAGLVLKPAAAELPAPKPPRAATGLGPKPRVTVR
jgi:hypothetical protein